MDILDHYSRRIMLGWILLCFFILTTFNLGAIASMKQDHTFSEISHQSRDSIRRTSQSKSDSFDPNDGVYKVRPETVAEGMTETNPHEIIRTATAGHRDHDKVVDVLNGQKINTLFEEQHGPGRAVYRDYDDGTSESRMHNKLTKEEKLIQESRQLEKMNTESKFKHLLGADDIPISDNLRSRRYRLPGYIEELYTAMLYDDDQTPQLAQENREMVVPTVTSYKGYRVGKSSHHGHSFRFNVRRSSQNYSRVELVVQTRERIIKHTDFFISILLKKDISDQLHYIQARDYSQYLIFDVTEISNSLEGRFDLVLKLTSTYGDVSISKHNPPLITTYENRNQNPLLEAKPNKRQKRSGNRFEEIDLLPNNYRQASTERYTCQRHGWMIDMSVFMWGWYVQPLSYDAGYCAGNCEFPLDSVMNSTNYSYIKNLWHYQTEFMSDYVPRACCVPISYYSQTIIYLNRNFDPVIKSLPHMRVAHCGCR